MNSPSFPTKKLFLFAIPALVLLTGIISAKEKIFSNETEGRSTQEVTVLNDNLSKFINETDADGDGLMDWEEVLWKTDPNSKFSAGRTVSDSEFVETQLYSPKIDGSYLAEESATDALSIELFNEYLSLKQSGQLTSDVIADMTSRLAEKSFDSSLVTNFSVPQNLKIPDTDIQSGKVYAETVTSLRLSYQNKYTQNQITQSDLSVTSADPDSSGIAAAAELYKQLASELKKMRVPISLVPAHELLILSYEQSATGLNLLSQFASDPLKGFAGLQMHSEAEVSEASALETIRIYLVQSDMM